MTARDLARGLRAAGFDIYRTDGDEVFLAERVRENLIMDAGVRLFRGGDPGSRSATAALIPSLTLAVITCARQRDFPGDSPEQLFERARRIAEPARARGFYEVGSFVTPVRDPGDPNKTLDHGYEVRFEKPVDDLVLALDEIRALLALDKIATR